MIVMVIMVMIMMLYISGPMRRREREPLRLDYSGSTASSLSLSSKISRIVIIYLHCLSTRESLE